MYLYKVAVAGLEFHRPKMACFRSFEILTRLFRKTIQSTNNKFGVTVGTLFHVFEKKVEGLYSLI